MNNRTVDPTSVYLGESWTTNPEISPLKMFVYPMVGVKELDPGAQEYVDAWNSVTQGYFPAVYPPTQIACVRNGAQDTPASFDIEKTMENICEWLNLIPSSHSYFPPKNRYRLLFDGGPRVTMQVLSTNENGPHPSEILSIRSVPKQPFDGCYNLKGNATTMGD